MKPPAHDKSAVCDQHLASCKSTPQVEARSEPPAWQLYVPFVVLMLSIIAIVVFVYGFCSVRSSETQRSKDVGNPASSAEMIR